MAADAGARRPVAEGRVCTMVGCESGVRLVAHTAQSPRELVGSAYTVCYQGDCEHGTIGPPQPGSSAEFFRCIPAAPPRMFRPCSARAEGTGATLDVDISAGSAAPADGDRVSLRIERDGARLFDHTRFVRYTDDYPNGPGCPGHCRGATVEIWPSSASGATCGSNQCRAGVRFVQTVPMTAAGAGRTTVTACRNQQCRTTDSDLFLWDWRDGGAGQGGEGVPLGAGSSGFAGFERFGPYLEYGPAGSGTYRLEVTFPGDTRLFAPGDRFSVEWRADATGAVLMKADETVTSYDESYPGGRACSPVACRTRTFSR